MKKEHKVKFSISLSPECNRVLTEFAKVTGTTKSAFISEVIDSQLEVLKGLTDTVKKANEMTSKQVSEKAAFLDT
jgi:predicted DNA-binding protein